MPLSGRASFEGVPLGRAKKGGTLWAREGVTLWARAGVTLRGVTTPGIGTGVKDANLDLVGVLGVEARVPSRTLRRSDMDCQAVGLSVVLFRCSQSDCQPTLALATPFPRSLPVLLSATLFPCPAEFPDGEPS